MVHENADIVLKKECNFTNTALIIDNGAYISLGNKAKICKTNTVLNLSNNSYIGPSSNNPFEINKFRTNLNVLLKM